MTKFTPHPDYNMLLIQARGMEQLVRGLEARISHQDDTIRCLHEEACLTDNTEINSQRQANADLSEENLYLHNCVEELANCLQEIVNCWDGPLYKHEMFPKIKRAKELIGG